MSRSVLLIGCGKMGREILSLLSKFEMEPAFLLLHSRPVTPLDIPWSTNLQDAPWDKIDLAIDFSSPVGLPERSSLLFDKKIPLVQGTTGWENVRERVLNEAKQKKASMVWSNNFSFGVALFKNIVSHTARLLQQFPEFDIALMEAHHKKKKDAPSGTLLHLQETLLKEFKQKSAGCSMKEGLLSQNEIDTASLRVGHIPGYHSVWIDGPFETIQLIHSARSCSVFADGALMAARLLLQKPGIWHFDQLIS